MIPDAGLQNRIFVHHGVSLMTYHKALSGYLWSIVVDLAIFLPFLVQYKYSLITHMILGALVMIIPTVTAYKSMLHGIPQKSNPMYFHKLFGFIITGIIIFQFALGLISYLIKAKKLTSPFTVLYIRWAHTLLGYALAIMSKLQVIVIMNSETAQFWFIVISDAILIILYLIRKFTHKKIESATAKELKNEYYLESSLNFQQTEPSDQIKIIYGNHIYDGRNVANNHPGGKQVILAIKNKGVERYLYGTEPLQGFPDLPLYSHSTQSIALLGSPIGKITIKMPYNNFDKVTYEVTSVHISNISQKPRVSLLMLNLQSQKKISYSGYSELQQLGRYSSLTNEGGITRLYSVVNFLHPKNQKFVRKCLAKIVPNSLASLGSLIVPQANPKNQVAGDIIFDNQNQLNVIPVLLKVYDDGKFTKHFLQKYEQKLVVSDAKGRGLALHQVGKGTVVFVGGGTGFYPYCDLIDLLFKRQAIKIEPQFTAQVLEQNPILKHESFADFKFIFMLAVNSLAQIHPITRNELFYLAENKTVELKIKVKEDTSLPNSAQKLTNSFGSTLKQMVQSSSIAHVYVCGPPRMNEDLYKTLEELHFSKYSFL